ncbi:major royal jelly protein 1-like [Odontomachus brunneus]|uniref:major royal jelly protein 1-like n=1 Tax=Odontomachus brunneus TaxID=486640 RepID=UPI0013F22357|nr:major royal jelly protein 1-like [Odontomachus brunneus]XP_032683236.1 major royal jelly protein 1-like [Odontomachus brunneus]XP_032683237.1 major royal jelly protein 1-like [Odontomachus brunneus]
MKRLILLALLAAVAMCSHEPFEVIFEWKTIDFQWPSDDERQYAHTHGDYIAVNNFFTTVKFWKDKMYLAIPRWRDGVPVTLAVTSARPVNGSTAPELEAFPSWAMQKLDDCSAFQLVHSMEIDPKGRMWVLDTGKPSTLREFTAHCPARLVILDLEDKGKILRTYEFPDHVARRGITYLNDIVLDHEDGGMAYITDSSNKDPGIIVYSLKNNTSWKIRHDSMKAKSEATSFMVAKTHVISPVNVDGIALSSASSSDRQVYYSPLSSFHLYSIPVSALKSNATNIDHYVRELGRKNSQTDGMVMSAKNVLYFGLLADDAISMWDIKNSSSFTIGQRVMSRDHVLTQWPDSFAFDEDGYLWCVVNMLQNFLNNRVNIDKNNYRLIRTRVNVKNYQFYENGTAPELPDINAGTPLHDSISFTLVTLLLVLILVTE